MTEDGGFADVYGPTISFECPVCGEEVVLRETPSHNFHHPASRHQPVLNKEDKGDKCEVHFSRPERQIRDQYDFIRYEIPLVFTAIPHWVGSEKVLQRAIDGMEDDNLGVSVEFLTSSGHRANAYAWYHENQPLYYVVVSGIYTPQNVLASSFREDLEEVLERWFNWEPAF